MRIKSDFVTNSSSTAFLLRGIIQGRLPRIPDSKKLMKALKGKTETSLSDYLSFSFKIPDPEDGDPGIATVSISNSYICPNNDGDEEPCSFININIDSPLGSRKQGRDSIVKEMVQKIFEAILVLWSKETPEFNRGIFSYLQYPEASGDGWDYGDPMGQYEYTYDLHLNETCSGKNMEMEFSK